MFSPYRKSDFQNAGSGKSKRQPCVRHGCDTFAGKCFKEERSRPIESMTGKIENLGFKAFHIDNSVSAVNLWQEQQESMQKELAEKKRRVLIEILFTLPVFILAMGYHAGWVGISHASADFHTSGKVIFPYQPGFSL